MGVPKTCFMLTRYEYGIQVAIVFYKIIHFYSKVGYIKSNKHWEAIQPMKKFLLLAILSMILVFNVIIPFQTQAVEKEQHVNIEKSALDKGITLTINNYTKKDGNLIIYYTVTSDIESVLKDSQLGSPFMDKPLFYSNKKRLNVGFESDQEKVNDYKYTGYVSIDLDDLDKGQSAFTFETDRISNQTGKWKIDFNI